MMVLIFLLAVLLAIPTLGLSIVGFLVFVYLKGRVRKKVQNHFVNEQHAENSFLTGERNIPSWINDKDEVQIFSEVVLKGALRSGVSENFIDEILNNEEEFLDLIYFAGAMEQQGASITEQQVAVAERVTQAWKRSLRDDSLHQYGDRAQLYISAYELAKHKGMNDESLESISKSEVITKWVKNRAQKSFAKVKDQQGQGEVIAELLFEAWQRNEKCIIAHSTLVWGLKHGLKEFESFRECFLPQEPFLMSDDAINDILLIESISGEILQNQIKSFPLIRHIPEQVFLLPNLKVFKLVGSGDIRYAQVNLLNSGLPKTIGSAKKLTRIELCFCSLKEVPPEVFTQHIKEIYLNMNRLRCLPDSIGQAKSLINLQLESNDLQSISDNIGEIDQLKVLCISGNYNLKKLPDSITNLESLTMFLHDKFENLTEDQERWLDEICEEDRVRSDGDEFPDCDELPF